MRVRSSFAFVVTIALFLVACTTAAPTAAPPTAAPPTAAPPTAAPPTAAPTPAPTDAPSPWKIGVVTDVGSVDDKNFNEYSFKGAQDGAADLGAAEPDVAVPADDSEYASLIQNFLDTDHNMIVTVGFNLGNDTAVAALANPNVWFIGVDQAPCLGLDGLPSFDFPCPSEMATLLPNFIGLQYAEDQAGYLAGIVAASISTSGNVGAVGGITIVPAVVKYLQGYELGAKSVNPAINVFAHYMTTSDFGLAFYNPGEGKIFAEQFIPTNNIDVMFQVAGSTGNGVLEAACEAGIHGLGVDVDQYLSLAAATTPAYGCIVTSAEKHLQVSVHDTILSIAADTATGGLLFFNASNNGVGISPENSGAGLITPAIQALVDAALAGMQAGTLVTCPATCGTVAP
jgi:basic membrane lipoprotein Med (substrate-binding protein (PBP1-ABC) superfamily)